MKKKMTVLISTLMALAMTLGFVGCDDTDDLFNKGGGGGLGGGGLGGNANIDQVIDRMEEMPETTNGNQIEGAIGEVFGVDINLPNGTYTSQSYTYGDMSTYIVTISNGNQTASSYYNSLKSEMTSKGYTAEDSERLFFKMVGMVMYTVTVESDGDDIVVYTSVSDMSSLGGGDVSGGGIPGGGIIPGGGGIPGGGSVNTPTSGELSAWPTAAVNDVFSFLGVTIPTFTYGTSYTISQQWDNPYNKLIRITCYGVTSDEVDAYRDELLDAGFYGSYSLFYEHGQRWWDDITVSRSSNAEAQTHTIEFSVMGDEPYYVMPENLQVRYSKGSYFNYEVTKIGDAYLLYNESYREYGYYVKNGVDYILFWKDEGGDWRHQEGDSYSIDSVDSTVFDFMVVADVEHMTRGERQIVAGRTVDVYTYTSSYVTLIYYKDVETGLILKYAYDEDEINYEVTSFTTQVTSFGDVELPILD